MFSRAQPPADGHSFLTVKPKQNPPAPESDKTPPPPKPFRF